MFTLSSALQCSAHLAVGCGLSPRALHPGYCAGQRDSDWSRVEMAKIFLTVAYARSCQVLLTCSVIQIIDPSWLFLN